MAVTIILMSLLGVASLSFLIFRLAETIFRRQGPTRPNSPTAERMGVPPTKWTGDELGSIADRSEARAHVANLLADPVRRAAGLVCFFEFDDLNRVPAEDRQAVVLVTARRLAGECRSDDLVARSDPTQLIVVAGAVNDNDGALALAARLGRLASLPIEVGESVHYAPASIGVTNLLQGDTAEEVLLRAQERMHIARGDLQPEPGY